MKPTRRQPAQGSAGVAGKRLPGLWTLLFQHLQANCPGCSSGPRFSRRRFHARLLQFNHYPAETRPISYPIKNSGLMVAQLMNKTRITFLWTHIRRIRGSFRSWNLRRARMSQPRVISHHGIHWADLVLGGVISRAQIAVGRMYMSARKFPVISHASGVRNQ